MAIDTAAKRRSVAGLHHVPMGPGVTPDATPGIEWRQQVGWGYSGIAAASPGGGGTILPIMMQHDHFGGRLAI